MLRLFVFSILLSFVSALHADEYDTLRAKWKGIIIGTGYDTMDPDVASKLVSIANSANSVWASMDKSATRTFLWSDNASTTISAHVTNTYSRLLIMA
ncbi:MAG: hyaluronate lyase, partial [Verrucomicrobia bacterium]|nr:hyaluronate lyase [Verrucomicrobiota bacterium]